MTTDQQNQPQPAPEVAPEQTGSGGISRRKVLGGILLSVAMSLASDKLTGDGPSLTGAEVVPDKPSKPDKVWDSPDAR